MKHTLIIIFSLLFISASFASCQKETFTPNNPNAENIHGNNSTIPSESKLRIKIGTSTFTATLNDNATATSYKALLPLTLNMQDLNSNEKYFDFSAGLPANAASPGTIQNGDLMLYGSRTLVLFYKTFSNSYNFTRLGRIQNVAGHTTALGSGNVTITFELE